MVSFSEPSVYQALNLRSIKHFRINQSIYLRQYVGWGCPDHPSQRLMYKTHGNKNTKLVKIQYI